MKDHHFGTEEHWAARECDAVRANDHAAAAMCHRRRWQILDRELKQIAAEDAKKNG